MNHSTLKFIVISLLILILVATVCVAQHDDSFKIKAEADSLSVLADSLLAEDQHQDALKTYELALSKYQQVKDRPAECGTLLDIGAAHKKSAEYHKALEYFQRGLEITRELGNRKLEGVALNWLGRVHTNLSEYIKAQEYLQQSLTIAREVDDREHEGYNLNDLGLVYRYLSNYPKALEYHQQSLAIAKEIGDREGESSCLKNIGTIYIRLADYPKALEYFQQCLTIAEETGNRTVKRKVLNNMAGISYITSDYLKALQYLLEFLEMCRESNDLANEGIALNNIGNVYNDLSNFPKALEYYQKSLEIAMQIGDRIGEKFAKFNIGNVYGALHMFEKALEYDQESLRLSRELDDKNGEASALLAMGTTYYNQYEPSKALESFHQCLEIFNLIGDRRMEGFTILRIGSTYSLISAYPEALQYHQQSLDIFKEIGDRKNECYALVDIGRDYLEQGEYAEALRCLNEALPIAVEMKAEPLTLKIYTLLGMCYNAQGEYDSAVENYSNAIEVAEKTRSRLDVEVHKTSYAAYIFGVYELLVITLLELNQYDEAYYYTERSRARSLLDLLASGDVKVGKSRHVEFLRKEEDLRNQQEEVEEQLLAVADDTEQAGGLRGKMEDLQDSRRAIIEEKKRYEPELASLVSVSALTLPEVQAIMDPESTILEYFLTEKGTIIWLISPNESEVFQVDISGDSLKTLVEKFRDTIVNLGSTEKLSRRIFDLLISPVQSKISTIDLVIIPHGILHYLPFQALQSEKGKYLLENYRIRYLPSASVLKYLKPKVRPFGERLLALGNPTTDRSGYSPIPLSETEVRKIAGIYDESHVLIGKDATEERFRELAPKYDILHLACHSELNSSYPLFSGLLLASGGEYDGELDVHELFTIDLNAYLVVLSACETGMGHLTTGDELVGLSRAFIYAGTPSILSSLWKVGDESTAYLMSQFYKKLKKFGKGEALRRAQLKTKKKYPNLQAWASFVLIGD